jgi:hypothetical protein
MRVPLQVHAFRKLLVRETDETKRQMLFLSLAQEEAQLKAQLRALGAKSGPVPAGLHIVFAAREVVQSSDSVRP